MGTEMESMKRVIEKYTGDIEIGTIRFKDASICWDFDRENEKQFRPVSDLRVIDGSKAEAGAPSAKQIWDSAMNGEGALNSGGVWGLHPMSSPLGVLAQLAYDGHLPQGTAFFDMLRQFAKVEGCDWAVHMIAALRENRLGTQSQEDAALPAKDSESAPESAIAS